MKEIKVLNQIYAVMKHDSDYVRTEGKTLGVCCSEDKTIELFSDDRNTYIHELLHAYLNEMVHKYDGEVHNEVNVNVFSKVIENMIEDGHLKWVEPK